MTTGMRWVPVTQRLRDAIVDARRARPPLSGADIERRTGGIVSRATVSSVVRGRQSNLTLERFVALARVLGRDPADLADVTLPQEWKLPREFEDVPLDERAEAQHVLAWILAIRGRRLRE